MFRKKVERWRPLVSRMSGKVPPSLILAIMTRESGGEVGEDRPPAYGLMQCKPITVQTYNEQVRPAEQITVADMTGKTESDAIKQLTVGIWYLRKCLNNIHKADPARFPWPNGELRDEQVLYADLCYARGFAGFMKYRQEAIDAGFADNWQGLQDYNPRYGHPDRPWRHSAAVLRMYQENRQYDVPGPPLEPEKPDTGGWLVAAIIILIAGLVAFIYWAKEKFF